MRGIVQLTVQQVIDKAVKLAAGQLGIAGKPPDARVLLAHSPTASYVLAWRPPGYAISPAPHGPPSAT
jgi:hypothetical protein